MGQIDITHQKTVAKVEHGKQYEKAIRSPVNLGFSINCSQKNATPLAQ